MKYMAPQAIILMIFMLIWPLAVVHSRRCYSDKEDALVVVALFAAPLYLIGAGYDYYVFDHKCEANHDNQ